ncbi:Secreted protein [Pseudomonas sp. IT-347P]
MLNRCLTTTATLLTFSLAAHGTPLPSEYLEECQRVENSAKAIMKARQEGVPLSSVLELADNAGKESEYVGNLYKALIGQAYDMPRESDARKQESAVADFQKTFYSLCIDSAQKTASERS